MPINLEPVSLKIRLHPQRDDLKQARLDRHNLHHSRRQTTSTGPHDLAQPPHLLTPGQRIRPTK